MSTTIRSGLEEPVDPGSAGAERSEPGGVPGMAFEIGGVSPVLGPLTGGTHHR